MTELRQAGTSGWWDVDHLRSLRNTAGPNDPRRRSGEPASWRDPSLQREEDAARELHHRVANSLQLAVNFLVSQGGLVHDITAREALASTAARLAAVGELHRFISGGGHSAMVEMDAFLAELGARLEQSIGLACRVRAEPVRLSAGPAQQLAIALNELATNTRKHGYLPHEPATASIDLWREDGGFRLRYADDGAGLPPGFDPSTSGGGLGLGVVRAAVRQIRGVLFVEPGPGARFTIAGPCAA